MRERERDLFEGEDENGRQKRKEYARMRERKE